MNNGKLEKTSESQQLKIPCKKRIFEIPVTWQLSGEVEVYATNFESVIEEAIKKETEGFGFALPNQFDYIDDSFEINQDLDLI